MITLMCKRQYAEEIIKGTKKYEIRVLSKYYIDNFFDRNMFNVAYQDYIKHMNNENYDAAVVAYDNLNAAYNKEATKDKLVKLTNYNRSWELIFRYNTYCITNFGFKGEYELFCDVLKDELSKEELQEYYDSGAFILLYDIAEIVEYKGL